MLVSASLIFQGSEISTLCDDINALSSIRSRAFKIAVRRLSLILAYMFLAKRCQPWRRFDRYKRLDLVVAGVD